MIADHLGLFNQRGRNFRALFFDPDREEIEPAGNVNDINRGALYNALEWHRRIIERFAHEYHVGAARGEFLDEWGRFWNIERPAGMSDDEAFARFILSRVLAPANSFPVLRSIYPTETIREPLEMGPYLDNAHLDAGPQESGGASFVFTAASNALYVIYRTPAEFSPGKARAAAEVKAAGVGIFFGVVDA